MRILLAVLLFSVSFLATAGEELAQWTDPVKIKGYSVAESGAPYVYLTYEGNLGENCASTERNHTVTYVNNSNSAPIQKAILLEAITARNKGMDVRFAVNEFSACNDDWGLQIFGIKSVSRTE